MLLIFTQFIPIGKWYLISGVGGKNKIIIFINIRNRFLSYYIFVYILKAEAKSKGIGLMKVYKNMYEMS